MNQARTIALALAISVAAAALITGCAGETRHEIAGAGTDRSEADEAFRMGWQHFRKFTVEDTAAAIVSLNRAVELDPGYGNAYAALAFTYLWARRFGWSESQGLSGRLGEVGYDVMLAKKNGRRRCSSNSMPGGTPISTTTSARRSARGPP